MKVEIESIVKLEFYIQPFLAYLTFLEKSFITLITSFPFNLIAASIFFLILAKAIFLNKKQLIVKLVREITADLDRGVVDIGIIIKKRVQISKQIQLMREKMVGKQMKKFDMNLVRELQKEEEELFKIYLLELKDQGNIVEEQSSTLAAEINELEEERQQIQKQSLVKQKR